MDFEGGTKIGGWPTCFNSLSWSADLSIAAVVGDIVEILSPKLQLIALGSLSSQQNVQSWHRIRLETNRFTEEEMPYFDPEPFRLFSLGGEQSPSQVASLAWSPPGLAKHQRCVLAVLTTSHILSIWAAGGDPHEARSWKRVLIINGVLRDYFLKEPALDLGIEGVEVTQRSRSRIQAFTWVTSVQEALSTCNPQDPVNKSLDTHAPYLVLSNDANEVVILQIFSPYLFPSESLGKWDATVVTKFHVPETTNEPHQTAVSYSSIFRPRYPITHIAVSTWASRVQHQERQVSCTIAYLAGTELNLRQCKLALDPCGGLIVALESLVIQGAHSGPLQWSRQLDEGENALLAFTNEEVRCITIAFGTNLLSSDDIRINSSRREDGWEPFSGACYAKGNSSGLFLYYSYHTLNAPEKLRSLKWPLDGNADELAPHWVQQVNALKQSFDIQHQLAGHVVIRIWGITSFDATDYVLVCCSFHPSDMIQYAMVSEQESYVIVSKESELPLNSCVEPSTEYCLFDISRWLNTKVIGKTLSDEEFDLLKRQIDLAYPVNDDPGFEFKNELELYTGTSRQQPFLQLRRAVCPYISLKKLLLQQLEKLRHTSTVAPDSSVELLSRTSVQRRLCSAVIHLSPQTYENSEQSRRILATFQKCRERTAQLWDPRLDLTMTTDIEETAELCEICDAVIPFEDFEWARCNNGHEYIRCGLTLFAIQSPGITKSCAICNQRYIADEFLQKIGNAEKSDQSHNETRVTEDAHAETLINLLLAAFPFCIYCGGKFVG